MSKSKIYIDAQNTRGNGRTVASRVWNRLLNIALARNVPVILTNMESRELDGLWIKEEGKSYIFIDDKLPKRKRNLVLAHELFHEQLHNSILAQAMYTNDKTFRVQAECKAQSHAKRLIRNMNRKERIEG